jgi:excisionase family DNA binding protein
MSPHDPRRRQPGRPPGSGARTQAAATNQPASGAGQPGPDLAAERLAYSVDEAARLTGLSRDLLYDEMRRGNLIYVKIGRRRLITRHHLQQFLGVTS